ncbi:arylesterase [Maribacter chungangensis]|uniref:Arylesterase n=1 Tax=Maribacter chungangensis TaxID=1069117 RepID=A0ABW3B588_9FLAO
MDRVLKFRYFLVALLLWNCGETPKQQKTEDTPTTKTEETNSVATETEETDDAVILFFGNSLTAAYGLDTEEGFPNQIQLKIDSLGLNYTVINSGLSGETTAGGRNRLDWVLNQEVDIFVLELGANDGLRGIPLTETRANLQAMIDLVREKNPETRIVLAGMQIPPNMGMEYTTEFRNIYPELAKANDVALIPFLLEGVAGVPELNLEDGIHPTADGQKIVANTVWQVLKPILK